MKRQDYFIIVLVMLMIGLLGGCGNETVETVAQDSLSEEETISDELAEVSFQRDIVGWNENEKRQCLEDLYESLEEFYQYKSNRDKLSVSKKSVSTKSESKKAEERYELTIYNSLGTIVLSEVYPEEPGISWVTENIMEIAISVGSPARYVYYVDLEEDRVSDVYFNPILVGDEYVAYMEDGKLILSDIFYTRQQDLLYMAIVRNFTETADPVSAIIGIELIDSENIELTYLTGNDYTVITEIISIDRDTEPERPELRECLRLLRKN